jgi:hypothetical protein
VVYNKAAPTVDGMSSCRATSFYLAPGVMRYFSKYTLVAVLPDGTMLEITHRRDVARLRRDHPEWDGSTLCAAVSGHEELHDLLIHDPTRVERWQIDERIIEGRRERGGAYELMRLFETGDISSIGGLRQMCDELFPGANKTLRTAIETRLEDGANSAMRLSFAAAMRGIITDDEIAAALREPSLSDVIRWGWESPQEIRTLFLTATKGLNQERRAMLAKNLVSVAGREAHETQGRAYNTAAASGALSLALQKRIAEEGSEEARSSLCENCSEELQHVLLADESSSVRAILAEHPNLIPAVREALLNDPDERVSAAVIRSSRDSAELERYAFSENPIWRYAALSNPHAEPELQLRMLEAALQGEDRSAVWGLAHKAHDERVLDALIENVSVGGVEGLLSVVGTRLTDEQLERAIGRLGDDWVSVLREGTYDDVRLHQRLFDKGEYNLLSQSPYLTSEMQRALLHRDTGTAEGAQILKRIVGTVYDRGVEELDEELQKYAINLREPDARIRFIARPELSDDVIRELLETGSEREVLAITPGAARLAAEIIQNAEDPKYAAEQLARNEHLDESGRALVWQFAPSSFARRSDLTHEEQLGMLRDEDSEIRASLASSQHTELSVLRRLTRDTDPVVQRAAVQNVAERTQRPAQAEYHFRERMAETRTVSHPIVDELREAAVCVNRSAHTEVRFRADDARYISDLPGADTIEFRGVRDVQDRLDGETFTVLSQHLTSGTEDADRPCELVARVIDSGRTLRQNAEYMRNCTSGYASRIAGGGTQIVQMIDEDGHCQLNVELERDDAGIWTTVQTNSRFNGYGAVGDDVPQEVRHIGEKLAKLMNEGDGL